LAQFLRTHQLTVGANTNTGLSAGTKHVLNRDPNGSFYLLLVYRRKLFHFHEDE
jgi:hypothetical protein